MRLYFEKKSFRAQGGGFPNKITQHHLSAGEMCRRHLGHVKSKTGNGVAALRHGVHTCIVLKLQRFQQDRSIA
jgi:hypothetical protein